MEEEAEPLPLDLSGPRPMPMPSIVPTHWTSDAALREALQDLPRLTRDGRSRARRKTDRKMP